MMKRLILSVTVICVLTLMAVGKSPEADFGLPALHAIKTVTLSPSYGCRTSEEFGRGYENTALFLSAYSKRRNSPDLLFNGACRSEDYFQVSTAGDDMALISDLGANVSLEDVSAHLAFNLQNVHSFPAYSKFVREAKVESNHTYAVLISKSDIRGLFLFTVTEYVPNKQVSLRYAVKSYQVMPGGRVESPGFDWERKNSPQ